MTDTGTIMWLAGLLEGEGAFSKRPPGHNPVIQLCMTDKDVVIRAAVALGAHKVIRQKRDTKAGKPIYRMVLYGAQAMGWMMTILPIMGRRRRAQIIECLTAWKAKTTRTYNQRRPYSRGAEIVWTRPEVSHS